MVKEQTAVPKMLGINTDKCQNVTIIEYIFNLSDFPVPMFLRSVSLKFISLF